MNKFERIRYGQKLVVEFQVHGGENQKREGNKSCVFTEIEAELFDDHKVGIGKAGFDIRGGVWNYTFEGVVNELHVAMLFNFTKELHKQVEFVNWVDDPAAGAAVMETLLVRALRNLYFNEKPQWPEEVTEAQMNEDALWNPDED